MLNSNACQDFRFAFYCEQQEWTRQLLYFIIIKDKTHFMHQKLPQYAQNPLKQRLKNALFTFLRLEIFHLFLSAPDKIKMRKSNHSGYQRWKLHLIY